MLDLEYLQTDQDKRLTLIRLNLCPTCRVLDRCACEWCYNRTLTLFRLINSIPLFFGGDE